MEINKYYEKLEFNKILDKLSAFCNTSVGSTLALNLLPSNKKSEVEQKLSETQESVSLIYKASIPPFDNFEDITKYTKTLEAEGTLSIKALLETNKIFNIASNLKLYFAQDFIESSDFSILSEFFNALYANPGITKKVSSIILDENTIDDKASSELSRIRQAQRKAEQSIKEKLNSLIHKPSYSKYIQENIITIRNDRFVIPIKEEYRSQVKGFVHDISNAGSTVFIEPTMIFDLNNELNNLKMEEEIEIEKILKDLSSLFYPYISELLSDMDLIGKLDFIFAKAKFSNSIKAITPIINDKKQINLINARHPLIDENKVVPISVNLGKDFSSLVITGPNTGGKTVTLKTIGLLELMACSGLNIPADEHSSIYVFDKIFADIGDNQSIADSLSTFSSHMLNIIDIVKNTTNNSLVLVDELGSGTDPLEGANLAISILEHLYNVGSLVVATTHYQELKLYALKNDGFENACVEFDLSTLSPTYTLLTGIPGKSNAFEISKKLGLPEVIIEKAKSLMSNDDIHIEELLKNIYDNKVKTEKNKKESEQNLNEISSLKEQLEKENISLKEKEKEIINKAKTEARNLLLDAKEEVADIIKEANSTKKSTKDLNNLRNNLNNDIKGLSVPLEWTTRKNTTPKNPSKSNLSTVSYSNSFKTKTVSTELNIIGMNVEEVIPIVDKFLDDATLAHLQVVRIIHGKGTGKLRNGIHSFLKKNGHVLNFRLGTYGEGEAGVTIVELR